MENETGYLTSRQEEQELNPDQDAWKNPVIYIKFSRTACRRCPCRALCTRRETEPRSLTIRPQAEHQALQVSRQQQQTVDWQTRYNRRAGIEGRISQGVSVFGLRRSRYMNLAKTHLQHRLTSAALNVVRLVAWLQGQLHTKTRASRFALLASAKS